MKLSTILLSAPLLLAGISLAFPTLNSLSIRNDNDAADIGCGVGKVKRAASAAAIAASAYEAIADAPLASRDSITLFIRDDGTTDETYFAKAKRAAEAAAIAAAEANEAIEAEIVKRGADARV